LPTWKCRPERETHGQIYLSDGVFVKESGRKACSRRNFNQSLTC
jgi:hypothetical protein